MEKNQYKLCIKIFRRLQDSGILNHLVLIGSWCIPFYQDYFSGTRFRASIRTRDIDFLIPRPSEMTKTIDIAELMRDLGFIVGHKGSHGIIKLEHPDLAIEFLVPERGRGTNKPIPLPKLGVNAQALRFLNFLTDNTITANIDDILISVPHPINYALHKMIIFQRRQNSDKAQKDLDSAMMILKAVVDKGETGEVKNRFNRIPKGWQRKIIAGLKKAGEIDILNMLEK